jgi:hypothetical protein
LRARYPRGITLSTLTHWWHDRDSYCECGNEKTPKKIKHGKPVAKVVPVGSQVDDIFNVLAGKGRVTGNMVSPSFNGQERGNLS